MEVNEDTWKFMQQHLGYTDEELEIFRGNPKNADIMSKAPDLMNKTIIAEVVASHGCNSQHHVGDKFYFDIIEINHHHMTLAKIAPFCR